MEGAGTGRAALSAAGSGGWAGELLVKAAAVEAGPAAAAALAGGLAEVGPLGLCPLECWQL